MDTVNITPELMRKGLHARSRFRSPAFGALLTLAILLGKAVVCRHAPGRTVGRFPLILR